MPVASPYAVFRASDLAWAPHPCAPAGAAARSLSPSSPPARLASRPPRPRKRLAPAGVIQGELFSLPG